MKRLLTVALLLLGTASLYAQNNCDTTFLVTSGKVFSPSSLLNQWVSSRTKASVGAGSCAAGIFSATVRFTQITDLASDTAFLNEAIEVAPLDTMNNFTLKLRGATGGRLTLGTTSASQVAIRINSSKLKRITIDSINFVDRGQTRTNSPLVQFQSALGGEISATHFNLSVPGNVGLAISASEITVSNSLFRSLNFSQGATNVVGIATTPNSVRTEIRTNIFYNTGIRLGDHSARILLNTFVGNVGTGSPVELTSDANSTANLVLWRNLFALRSPAAFSVAIKSPVSFQAPDSLIQNVFNTEALVSPTTPITTSGNIKAPLGWADYSNLAFPLTEMTQIQDSLKGNTFRLPVEHTKLGNLIDPDLLSFKTSFEANSESVRSLWQRVSYNRGSNPLSYGEGTWATGVRVGAVGNAITALGQPSPIDTVQVSVLASDSTKFTLKKLSYLQSYYNTINTPSTLYFFMSRDSLLLAGNGTYRRDSSLFLLPSAQVTYLGSQNANSFQPDTIPVSFRDATGNVFVKVLPFANNKFAPEIGTSITRLANIPNYPMTDFKINGLTSGTNSCQLSNITFEKGSEDIDTVGWRLKSGVQILKEGKSRVNTILPTITGLEPGVAYTLEAWPVSKYTGFTNGIIKDTSGIRACAELANIRYVKLEDSFAKCPVNTQPGTKEAPFCKFDSLVIKKGSGPITVIFSKQSALADSLFVLANGDTSRLTLVSENFEGPNKDTLDLNQRPLFRKIVITRPNVTLKGFIIESSENAPGITLAGKGAIIEKNLFRKQVASQKVASHFRFLNLLTKDSVSIQSNLVFDGAPVFEFNSPGSFSILNNTFIDTDSLTNSFISQAPAAAGILLNFSSNFLTGLSSRAYRRSLTLLTGTTFLGENNALVGSTFFTGATNTISLEIGSVPGLPISTTPSIAGNTLRKNMEDFFKPSSACNKLWSAGSLKNRATTDFFGRSILGKSEVGAFEAPDDSLKRSCFDWSIDVPAANKVDVSVSSLQFPDNPTLHLHMWLIQGTDSTFSNAQNQKFSYLASSQQTEGLIKKVFPINLNTNLGFVDYTLCLDWGNASKPFIELDGSSLSKSCKKFTTPRATQHTDCADLTTQARSRCPNEGRDPWIVANGLDSLEFGVRFSTPVVGPNISRPLVEPVTADVIAVLGTLVPRTGLPVIRLTNIQTQAFSSIQAPKLTQNWSVFFRKKVNLEGATLVRIDANQNILTIATWESTDSATGTLLKFSDKAKGSAQYVFTDPTGVGVIPLVSPKSASDKISPVAALTLQTKISGQFKTSNPFFAVLPIPAGALLDTTDVFVSTASGQKYYPSRLHIYHNSMNTADSQFSLATLEYFYKLLKNKTAQVPAGFGKIPLQLPGRLDTAISKLGVKFDTLPLFDKGIAKEIALQAVLEREYATINTKRKITRSIELLIATVDGGLVSYTRQIIPTAFKNSDLTNNSFTEITKGVGDIAFLSTRRWNLISFPWQEEMEGSSKNHNLLGIPDSLKSREYSDSRFFLYTWENGKYQKILAEKPQALNYSAGKAVWVAKYSVGSEVFRPISQNGSSLDFADYKLALDTGWNYIGLPFNFPVRWVDVVKSQIPTIYEYNNSWSKGSSEQAWVQVNASDTLRPWKGYAVLMPNRVAGQLTFPVLEASRSISPLAKSQSFDKQSVELELITPTLTTRLSAGKGIPEKWAAPPGIPGVPFQAGFKDSSGLLAHSIRSAQNQGKAEVWDLYIPQNEVVQLRISNSSLPDSQHAALIDPSNGTVKYLAAEPLALGQQSNSGLYKLVIGSEEQISALSSSGLYTLNAFPRVFKNQVKLTYSLPQDLFQGSNWKWKLEVYDMRGRTVYTKSSVLQSPQWSFDLMRQDLQASSQVLQVRLILTNNQGQKWVGQNRLIKL